MVRWISFQTYIIFWKEGRNRAFLSQLCLEKVSRIRLEHECCNFEERLINAPEWQNCCWDMLPFK